MMDRPTLRHGSPADVAAEFDRRAMYRTGFYSDTHVTELQLALANALDRIAKLEDRLRVMQQASTIKIPTKWPTAETWLTPARTDDDIHDD